jgi:hypothetical protein
MTFYENIRDTFGINKLTEIGKQILFFFFQYLKFTLLESRRNQDSQKK